MPEKRDVVELSDDFGPAGSEMAPLTWVRCLAGRMESTLVNMLSDLAHWARMQISISWVSLSK